MVRSESSIEELAERLAVVLFEAMAVAPLKREEMSRLCGSGVELREELWREVGRECGQCARVAAEGMLKGLDPES